MKRIILLTLLPCITIFYGCSTILQANKSSKQVVDVFFAEANIPNDCHDTDFIKSRMTDFFTSYFCEDELTDMAKIISDKEYLDLRDKYAKNSSLENRQQLEEFIRKKSKTGFWDKIQSNEFKNSYNKYMNDVITETLSTPQKTGSSRKK